MEPLATDGKGSLRKLFFFDLCMCKQHRMTLILLEEQKKSITNLLPRAKHHHHHFSHELARLDKTKTFTTTLLMSLSATQKFTYVVCTNVMPGSHFRILSWLPGMKKCSNSK